MKNREGNSKQMEDVEMEVEVNPDSLDCSAIYHVLSDVLAFLLYMHHQIPSMLQDMTLEFGLMQTEYKELEMVLTQEALNISTRRKHAGRKREVRYGIRRVEKLMGAVTSLLTALQLIISEVPSVESVIFVFGNPRRPQHIYEMCFPCGKMVPQAPACMSKKNQLADRLSRKVIRVLTSKGIGSSSYSGPSKLFLMVKAPAAFNMPQHFLPKRNFQYSNKRRTPIYRLRLKHRTLCPSTGTSNSDSVTVTSLNFTDGTSDDLIWFQCRHVIKGLPDENPPPEE